MSQLFTQSQAAALHAACEAVYKARTPREAGAALAEVGIALDACKPAPYVRRKAGSCGLDDITPRQAEFLAFIDTFIADYGISPTFREIAVALGISSPNGVQTQIRALAKKGRLTWQANLARSIRILEPADA